MEEEEEDEAYAVGNGGASVFGSMADKLRRASHRLSEMMPKALRFSMMGPAAIPVVSANIPLGQRVCLRVRPARLLTGAAVSKSALAAATSCDEQPLVVTVSSPTELVLDRPPSDRQNM